MSIGESLLADQNNLALTRGALNRFLAYRLAGIQALESAREAAPPVVQSSAPATFSCEGCGRKYPDRSSLKLHETRCNASKGARPVSPSRSPGMDSGAATTDKSSRGNSVGTGPVIDVESMPLIPPEQRDGPDFAHANDANGIPATASMGKREECEICGRVFLSDRIAKHRVACKKSFESQKQRKQFDMKQRRLEVLLETNQADPTELRSDPSVEEKLALQKKKKANWRQQSAQFQNAMKNINSGDTAAAVAPDFRVECAGCGRKFDPETAERHVPRCVAKSRGR